jgi:hypothetical protein
VIAPVGTVAVILDFECRMKFEAVPLNVTFVAPVRSVPRIVTFRPTLPDVGNVSPFLLAPKWSQALQI